VTRALVHERHRVRVLVRNTERLGTLRAVQLDISQGDILDMNALVRAMRGVDAVVHCAASVSLRPRDRSLIYETNVVGTRNVLDAAAALGVRVLHTSSIASVGPTQTPTVLDEAAPREALPFEYPYAASKRESEDIALAYARAGRDVVVLNPGIMLGPDDVYFSSTEFIMRYLRSELGIHLAGGGSFCDVRDVAHAYTVALRLGRSGERYILAGVNRRYGDVLEELRQLTGLQRSSQLPRPMALWGALWSELGARVWQHPLEKFNVPVVRWGSLFNFCHVGKAEQELGYRPRNFTQTLIDTVVDQLQRQAARPVTPELRALLAAPRAAPAARRPRARSPAGSHARRLTRG
jgi:dihydroflavonol-4-reductase